MRSDKYTRTMRIVLTRLKDDRSWHQIAPLAQEASDEGGWKFLNGISLGIRSWEEAGLVEVSNNGKMVRYLGNGAAPAPNMDAQERQLREALEKANRARQTYEENKVKLIEERDAALAKANKATSIHEVRIVDDEGKVVRAVKASFHAAFPRILALAKARKNIFIYGPTGCGKTHIARQLAEVLGLPFAFISCSAGMSEGKLEGRLLPTGEGGAFEYSISEFIRCYENGGVYLIDEIDAADPNVLLLINAALANGHVAVPNRPEKPYAERHKDFICIAAANTVGTGADRMYSGRNKLDAATLDRFQIGKVMMDYDAAVEAELCPDMILRNRLTRYRNNIRAHRLERALSTRFMSDAYDMKQQGWSLSDIDEALFTGWREDEINKVKGA